MIVNPPPTGTAPSLGFARLPRLAQACPIPPDYASRPSENQNGFSDGLFTDFIMQPTLDVIIPCYNAANTLRAAAESALAQSVVQTVWLVDDTSDDGTPDIMRELAAQYPQIRCEYLPANGGAARARN